MLKTFLAAVAALSISTGASYAFGGGGPCVPFPACLGGGGSPSPGGSGSHHHPTAGRVAGRVVVWGLAASSTALVVRGSYVALTEHREMRYGEAYCTAELFSPLVFKPIRLLGDLLAGSTTPLQDVVFCPEKKLNDAYSPQPKLHAHKRHRTRIPLPRIRSGG